MTDAPTPEDLHEEPGFAEIDPAAIAQEAQENFSLVDIFNPRSQKMLAKKKRLIYTDLEAVDEYNTAKAALTLMEQAFAAAEEAEDKNVDGLARAEAEISQQKAVVEERAQKMLRSALAFHLRAYPNVAMKVARKEARRIFIDKETGTWYEGVDDAEVQEWMDEYLFGDVLQKVVNAQGEEVDFGQPVHEIGHYLSDNMHPAIWRQLMEDVNELLIRSGIARASVEEPGF